MYFYKKENGSVISFFRPLDGLEEITEKEYRLAMDNVIDSLESSPPAPTEEERLEAMESAVLEILGVNVDG